MVHHKIELKERLGLKASMGAAPPEQILISIDKASLKALVFDFIGLEQICDVLIEELNNGKVASVAAHLGEIKKFRKLQLAQLLQYDPCLKSAVVMFKQEEEKNASGKEDS